VVQETRLYDADRDETRSMRSKEDAHDYRYFPDPDLLPIVISETEIEAARAALPELPQARAARYEKTLGIGAAEAEALSSERAIADYFEALLAVGSEARQAANWITGEIFARLNRESLDFTAVKVGAPALAGLLARVKDQTVSTSMAKQVFEAMWDEGGDADQIIEARGLKQVTDTGEIESLVQAVLDENADQVAQYRAGKDKVLGFFVGQVMKRSKGKASPQVVNDLVLARLKE
jgi:aspartyl-tRNA(Asn)/glutamyl-tRNA(Gln) amidotransferase subunit B